MEEFSSKGYWYLPENEKNKVPGRLTFDPAEGATLELMGSLVKRERGSETHTPEIILGINELGKEFTLHDCAIKGRFLNIHRDCPRHTRQTLSSLVHCSQILLS